MTQVRTLHGWLFVALVKFALLTPDSTVLQYFTEQNLHIFELPTLDWNMSSCHAFM